MIINIQAWNGALQGLDIIDYQLVPGSWYRAKDWLPPRPPRRGDAS